MSEDDILMLEGIANIARGMTMDPRIPSEVRSILIECAMQIDALTERLCDEGEDEAHNDRQR